MRELGVGAALGASQDQATELGGADQFSQRSPALGAIEGDARSFIPEMQPTCHMNLHHRTIRERRT